MPFGPLPTPSIGLGLLKASLTPRGISSRTLYFSLRFAEQIGAEALGFVDVEPIPAYRYIYPFPRKTVANLAYYFT